MTSKPTILMCPPDYFTVDYVINPWMRPGTVDTDLARRQWDTLKQTIETQAGAHVEVLAPVEGTPDLVFTANAAFVHGKTAILARYRHAERQPETPVCEAWFNAHGYQTHHVPGNNTNGPFFEGAGDALKWRNPQSPHAAPIVFAGYRTRTDIASHNAITTLTGLSVLSLELATDAFYHIDVCICPMENGVFLYYPEAFDVYGLQVIESNIPEAFRVPITTEEAQHFSGNAVNIGDTVIYNQGSPRVTEALRSKGLNVIELDLSEFLKSGGSAKCLTLRIA
jgi:N-dimethylarginine dimethylaminohydrolase